MKNITLAHPIQPVLQYEACSEENLISAICSHVSSPAKVYAVYAKLSYDELTKVGQNEIIVELKSTKLTVLLNYFIFIKDGQQKTFFSHPGGAKPFSLGKIRSNES
jgi:hypothetical protein